MSVASTPWWGVQTTQRKAKAATRVGRPAGTVMGQRTHHGAWTGVLLLKKACGGQRSIIGVHPEQEPERRRPRSCDNNMEEPPSPLYINGLWRSALVGISHINIIVCCAPSPLGSTDGAPNQVRTWCHTRVLTLYRAGV